MAAPFAALQNRVNRSVADRLSDSVLIWNGAVEVSGLLTRQYVNAFGEIVTNQPLFSCLASAVDGVKQGDSFLYGELAYRAVQVQPDGTGMLTITLERVSG